MLIVDDTRMEIFLLITTFIIIVANYFYNSYKYWARKGVATIKPTFPLGNTNSLLPQGNSLGVLSREFYDEFKQQGQKFGGVYLVTAPNLVLVDPEYIKDILAKDFQYFVDRGFYYNKKRDPLGAHLFAIDGLDWRNLRIKLTPTFTSGKMKMMFRTVVECSNNMKEAVTNNLPQDIEIKDIMSRFTTDVIGSCTLGIDCNSFKHPNAKFRMIGKKIFTFGTWKSMKSFLMLNVPKLAQRMGVCTDRTEVRRFFKEILAGTIKMRQDNNIRRNDFLQILLDLQETTNFSLDEMASQVFLFFVAGFETSSMAMSFAVYELARNPELQKKLREEICQVLERHNDELTYESLKEMKFLGRVLDETLRMYPSLPTLNRRCVKDYTLRDTDIVIEKDTPILISTLGLHMDPEFYPEPEKFDPDRFSDENKKERHPFVYLPFGDGPRNCIGLRFGLMQSKIGIATIIKNFHVSVSSATKPVEFNPLRFILNTTNPIYLKAEKV